MREASPVLVLDGVGVALTKRADIDEAFRRPEIYSSNASAVDLGDIRPLIPLQIDPPEHTKFRKLLDPIFAPKRMALLADPLTKLVNDLIDGFIDDGEVDFAAQFSVPYPSQVFLTLLGLPIDELPRFLAMKDGIIRPNHVTGKAYDDPETKAHQRATATSIYEYFDRILDERQDDRRDDLVSLFLDSEVDGHQLISSIALGISAAPAAGRRPRANTDEVILDREVNRHLAFGGGVHRCLGSHLARQELRIALREWHRRIPEYAVAPGAELVYTPAIRSIEHFPMVFTPA